MKDIETTSYLQYIYIYIYIYICVCVCVCVFVCVCVGGWRPRRRWVDNIRTDLQEVEWTGLGWPRIETGGGRL